MNDPWGPVKHFVQCYYCKKSVNATEQGVVEEGSDVFLPLRTTLVSCDECGGGLVFKQYRTGHKEYDSMERVWPGPLRRLSTSIPESLREEHFEATRCFEANAYTAAVVMVRRTLEGVAAENGIKERNLLNSLGKMKEKQILDPRLFEWSQALRVLGNEGAHFTGKRVSREDAHDALSLSEAILDYLYVLTAKFEEFKDRRAAAAAKAKAAPDSKAVAAGEPEDVPPS